MDTVDAERSTLSGVRSLAPRAAPLRGGWGLSLTTRRTEGGTVELAASDQHAIKIQSEAPVRGHCGKTRFVYAPGDCDLLPAGTSDRWHEEGPSTSRMLQLSPRLLRRAAEEMGRDPDRATLAPRHQLRDPQIDHIVAALERCDLVGPAGRRLYIESLGLALSAHLLGAYGASAAAHSALDKRQLARVLEYIDAHLDRDLSLLKLASVAEVSATTLKQRCRRALGMSVHEYVVRRRIERARELLLRGELPIAQVALDAGFAHQSHLARSMRKVLGVSPGELRKGR